MLEIDDKNLKFEIDKKENIMKRGGFWKGLLALPLLVTLLCGHLENTEARLPKEIAEAVTPILLEAAGVEITPEILIWLLQTNNIDLNRHIDLNEYLEAGVTIDNLVNAGIVPADGIPVRRLISKINISPAVLQKLGMWPRADITPLCLLSRAVTDLIYTETGNQEIVNWVRSKENVAIRPTNGLISAIISPIIASNTINIMELLFPCYTGTLTAYMHHSGRSLGYWVRQSENFRICTYLITGNSEMWPNGLTIERSKINPLKTKLDKDNVPRAVIGFLGVLFTVEILDTLEEVNGMLENIRRHPIEFQLHTFSDQYMCRPISNSATDSKHSDCIETTIKHLVAIICNDGVSGVNIQWLPSDSKIANYFTRGNTIMGGTYNAGALGLGTHKDWTDSLIDTIGNIQHIQHIQPTVWGLAKTLFHLAQRSPNARYREVLSRNYENCDNRRQSQNLEIGEHAAILDRDKTALGNMIKFALCTLGNFHEGDIEIEVSKWEQEKLNSVWPTEKVTIIDRKHSKTIVVGTGGCIFQKGPDKNKVDFNGIHSEIISISH